MRRNLPDGTYYFLEAYDPPSRYSPTVYRSTVTDGIPLDEFWKLSDNRWAPTPLLRPYRIGLGEHELIEVSELDAERVRAAHQDRWDADHL